MEQEEEQPVGAPEETHDKSAISDNVEEACANESARRDEAAEDVNPDRTQGGAQGDAAPEQPVPTPAPVAEGAEGTPPPVASEASVPAKKKRKKKKSKKKSRKGEDERDEMETGQQGPAVPPEAGDAPTGGTPVVPPPVKEELVEGPPVPENTASATVSPTHDREDRVEGRSVPACDENAAEDECTPAVVDGAAPVPGASEASVDPQAALLSQTNIDAQTADDPLANTVDPLAEVSDTPPAANGRSASQGDVDSAAAVDRPPAEPTAGVDIPSTQGQQTSADAASAQEPSVEHCQQDVTAIETAAPVDASVLEIGQEERLPLNSSVPLLPTAELRPGLGGDLVVESPGGTLRATDAAAPNVESAATPEASPADRGSGTLQEPQYHGSYSEFSSGDEEEARLEAILAKMKASSQQQQPAAAASAEENEERPRELPHADDPNHSSGETAPVAASNLSLSADSCHEEGATKSGGHPHLSADVHDAVLSPSLTPLTPLTPITEADDVGVYGDSADSGETKQLIAGHAPEELVEVPDPEVVADKDADVKETDAKAVASEGDGAAAGDAASDAAPSTLPAAGPEAAVDNDAASGDVSPIRLDDLCHGSEEPEQPASPPSLAVSERAPSADDASPAARSPSSAGVDSVDIDAYINALRSGKAVVCEVASSASGAPSDARPLPDAAGARARKGRHPHLDSEVRPSAARKLAARPLKRPQRRKPSWSLENKFIVQASGRPGRGRFSFLPKQSRADIRVMAAEAVRNSQNSQKAESAKAHPPSMAVFSPKASSRRCTAAPGAANPALNCRVLHFDDDGAEEVPRKAPARVKVGPRGSSLYEELVPYVNSEASRMSVSSFVKYNEAQLLRTSVEAAAATPAFKHRGAGNVLRSPKTLGKGAQLPAAAALGGAAAPAREADGSDAEGGSKAKLGGLPAVTDMYSELGMVPVDSDTLDESVEGWWADPGWTGAEAEEDREESMSDTSPEHVAVAALNLAFLTKEAVGNVHSSIPRLSLLWDALDVHMRERSEFRRAWKALSAKEGRGLPNAACAAEAKLPKKIRIACEERRLFNREVARLRLKRDLTLTVLRRIERREKWVNSLQEFSQAYTSHRRFYRVSAVKQQLEHHVERIRECTIDVMGALLVYRKDGPLCSSTYTPFKWRGCNYFLKVLSDLLFLNHSPLQPFLKFSVLGNPLLLHTKPGAHVPRVSEKLIRARDFLSRMASPLPQSRMAVEGAAAEHFANCTATELHSMQEPPLLDVEALSFRTQRARVAVQRFYEIEVLQLAAEGREEMKHRRSRVWHLMTVVITLRRAITTMRQQLRERKAACKLQTFWRKSAAARLMRQMRKERQASITLQKWVRGLQARQRFIRSYSLFVAARRVQCAFRRMQARCELQLLRRQNDARIVVQRFCKKQLIFSKVHSILYRNRAMKLIQKNSRRFLAIKEVAWRRRLLVACLAIQRAWRCHVSRCTLNLLLRQRDAAIFIQKHFRACLAKCTVSRLLKERAGAHLIWNVWQLYQSKRIAGRKRLERDSATTIQLAWRTCSAKMQKMHLAECRQRHLERHVLASREIEMERAAIVVQTLWKERVQRESLMKVLLQNKRALVGFVEQERLQCAVMIQCCARRWAARRSVRAVRGRYQSALKIQRRLREKLQRSIALKHEKAYVIQRAWHSYCERVVAVAELERLRAIRAAEDATDEDSAAVLIQSVFRAWSARTYMAPILQTRREARLCVEWACDATSAALVIQSGFRMCMAKRLLRRMQAVRDHMAASRLQALYRGFADRKYVRSEAAHQKFRQSVAATLIQTLWKCTRIDDYS